MALAEYLTYNGQHRPRRPGRPGTPRPPGRRPPQPGPTKKLVEATNRLLDGSGQLLQFAHAISQFQVRKSFRGSRCTKPTRCAVASPLAGGDGGPGAARGLRPARRAAGDEGEPALARPPRFGTPQLVAELSGSGIDEDPTFTADRLEVYFMSDARPATKDIWTARRATRHRPGLDAARVGELRFARL